MLYMKTLQPLGTERTLSVRSPQFNCTTAFALPFIADKVFAHPQLIEAYAADCKNETVCKIPGNALYVLVGENVTIDEINTTFASYPGFKQFYRTEHGIVVEYELKSAEEKQCLQAVLSGKYSKIPQKLLHKLDKSNSYHVVLGLIANKDTTMRQFIEQQVGVKLDEDAEVWSRPYLEREVYRASNATSIELPNWQSTSSVMVNCTVNES